MTYKIVTVENEDGSKFQAYEAKVGDRILHIDKDLVDMGLTTMEDEIKAMLEASHANSPS